MDIKQINEQRSALMTKISDLAKKDVLNTEERSAFDRMSDELTVLNADANRAQRAADIEAEIRSSNRPPRAAINNDPSVSKDPAEVHAEEVRAFESWMKGTLKSDDQKYLRYEARAITGGPATGTTGGGVLVPVGMDSLHVATKNIGELLGAIRVINSDSTELLRIPFLNDVNQVGTIQGENVAATESDPTLSATNSYVDQWNSGMITVGNPTLNSSAFNVQEFISEAISTRFQRYANNAITNGNSSNVSSLLASAANVTAATGTTTALNLKALLQVFSALDASFRTGSAFLCNTQTWISLSGILDAQGRPVLTSDLQGSPFKLLLGQPILISEAMPNIGVSTQPLAYGNFRTGYTARFGNLAVRKSTDRFFEQNATVFAGWNAIGGFSTAVSGAPNPIVTLTTSAT